jgi:acetyl CoA:N6-hydroxylysine acetyl transferase
VTEFSLRPLADADFDRLWSWMNQPHVDAFWQLAGSRQKLRHYLDQLEDAEHSEPMIGELDGRPMSYWELYWAARDPLAGYYAAHPMDRGVHLLIGAPEDTGRGLGVRCLQDVTHWLLGQHTETQRIVAEPDVRNERVLKTFAKCGYRRVLDVDLPDKRAALVMHERAA